ncbi:MAG: TonB-dependent receptor [Thermodesulfobacteriota bacterium]|nr:TonB-dependent receptor [Thermodesulfobacteriota bacterium]
MKGLMTKIFFGGLIIHLMWITPAICPGEEVNKNTVGVEEAVLDEVVVSATRTHTPVEEVGSSITVITNKEMEARGQRTVKDVIKGTLGLDVWTNGGPGSMSSVSLRGANPYHTLVLIDGVEMNDPTNMNRIFDFGNLMVDNIDRIEILRGPQSPLYGADAIGGVINIITKKGEGNPGFLIGSEGGSYNTWRKFGRASMGNKKLNASMAISHNGSDGFSSADDDMPGNSEDDKWENTTASTRVGYVFSEFLDMDFIARFRNSRIHLDNGGGPYQDQKDYHEDARKVFTRSRLNFITLDGLWEQIFIYGYANHTRDYKGSPYGDSDYDGEKHEISWQHNLYLNETNLLTMGLEHEIEKMDDHSALDVSSHTSSFFIQEQIKLGGFFFTTFGVRYDDHKEFGDKTTFRITQAILEKKWNTKLKGSYGTGFRSPSLYELYAPPFGLIPVGNSDLDPEESSGWDIGIERSFCKNRLTLGITYFFNDIDSLIDWDWSTGYVNVNDARTEGVESFIELIPNKNISFCMNYTYTDTSDDDGSRLIRRPLHKIGFNTFYRFMEKWNINLNILYVGKRDDSYWDSISYETRDVVIDDYLVVNLSGSFDLSDRFRIVGRIDNLFDENYYESYGFGTSGFSAYGGINVTF